ncbi:dirigent protein 16-like isoform X2 [Prosopis cineraria]|uniref:dirigent protein 16-like isoform X2 n=1 Tax=Prosopis cineraria TaxID=364024 RepID=UPI0024109256|nr:dirigent protein 16-like isoform X2 [Prosopis cineraria]
MSSKSLAVLLWLLLASVLVTRMAAAMGGGGDERESVIEMYLHDIIGVSNPTARPTTGLLGSIYSGQVPFATPVGFKTPQGGIPIPNSNGALPTVNGVTGIPLGSGLSGTTFADLGSQAIGRAQGIYMASSSDGSRQMMVFTAMFEGGEYGDSLNFYGVYKIRRTMSRLSVTGGTGKFKNARGFAEVRSLIPPGQIAVDGAETLLRITIHLNHH